jgi:PAS domain S-box-containing protein
MQKKRRTNRAADESRVPAIELHELMHELRTYREEVRAQTEQLINTQTLLESSRDDYADLFDFAPVAYVILDRWGMIRAINLAGAAMLGIERARILSMPLRRFLAAEDRKAFLDHMRTCRGERGHNIAEMKIRTEQGQQFRAQLITRRSLRADEHGWSYLTTVLDLSEREKQQELRNTLLRQLMDAQEQERRRLSRELHDELGQHVTALILGLKQIRQRSNGSHISVEELLEIANKIGVETHRVALNLRPTALDDLGLQAALAHYVEDWSRTSGVRAEFQFTGRTADRLPSDIETTLYRVVQEALTNVARHAKASRASVIVHRDEKAAHVIIEDDGQGFDASAALTEAPAGRLGILGMNERALLAGGSFELESRPGHGTTVFVHLPTSAREGSANDEP